MFFLTFILLWISVSSSSDQLQNVALRARATHSTTVKELSSAINAIDGNADPLFPHGSCFSSQFETSPWFRVDLLKPHRISHIKITNRGDCCETFINGAKILIGDSLANNGNDNPSCATITTIPLGGTQKFLCNNMEGRYVNIILPGKTGYLTFCEVQIFGVPVSNYCCNA